MRYTSNAECSNDEPAPRNIPPINKNSTFVLVSESAPTLYKIADSMHFVFRDVISMMSVKNVVAVVVSCETKCKAN